MKNLKPGSSFTAYTDFISETGSPLVLNSAPEYSMRDSGNNLILNGVGEQAPNKAERWQAIVSVPSELPAGNYYIVWKGLSDKVQQISREEFSIVDATPNYYELDLLIPEKSSVVDVLKADSGEEISDASVSIITPNGQEIYSGNQDITERSQGGNTVFQLKTPALSNLYAGESAFALYLINWTFNADGQPQVEHHFAYIVNPKVLAYVNELRRMIDKPGLQNPNVALRYNNVDLVAYLNQGVQYVNMKPPQQTNYTLANIPDNLYIYVLYAAAVHALESRYMAEAEAAFNFSGQPIQLEVDRTQFIDAAISRYQENLSDINDIKRGIALSGGGSSGGGMGYGSAGGNTMGVLSLSVGPMVTLSILPQYNNRVAGYDNILYNLGYTSY